MEMLESGAMLLRQGFAWLQAQSALLSGLCNGLTGLVQQLKRLRAARRNRNPTCGPGYAYETRWLELSLVIADACGERAVLTRRQCVRFLRDDAAVVRELVWGEGEQLVRYTARGARRLGVRGEGSRRTVLLDPERRPQRGDRRTISSRRTIRGGFRTRDEYCEALLERPTGRLQISVCFPAGRPPKAAQLVVATTETVLCRLRPRYRADGGAVLRCRVQQPLVGVTYSLRWRW